MTDDAFLSIFDSFEVFSPLLSDIDSGESQKIQKKSFDQHSLQHFSSLEKIY